VRNLGRAGCGGFVLGVEGGNGGECGDGEHEDEDDGGEDVAVVVDVFFYGDEVLFVKSAC
jgi:hypothetical protein